MAESFPIDWSLEIVPAHADRVDLFHGLVDEIFVTLIPGTAPEKSLRAVELVRAAGFTPVPHITARSFQSKQQLDTFFAALTDLHVTKALILAGGLGQPAGPFGETLDILKSSAFANSSVRTVAVAGHPEGNPEDPDSWQSLQRKNTFLAEAGRHMEIITQWTFSPRNVTNYISRLREKRITAPVRAGIAGPANFNTLLKYAKTCGVTASKEVLRKQGLTLGRLLLPNKPDRQVEKIHGTPHFHLYPFGGLDKCANWLKKQTHRLPLAS